MKKLILIVIIISSFISACKKTDVEIPDKPIDKPVIIKPYKIELSIDKAIIKGNNIDAAILKTKVTDINGVELSDAVKLTANGVPFTGTAFKTSIQGDYTFQGSIGTLLSNSVSIKVNENLDGKPYKIELTTDKISSFIAAYNLEEVNFQTKVTDVNGTVLTDKPNITVNGNPFLGTSFKTNTPGTYIFEASLGTIKSNTKTIYAEERAEKYVTIISSKIEKINSVGLVQIGIQFKNISNKRLKYIAFSVSCYNAVNDLMKEEITGRTTYTFNATGFWEPNIERYPSYEIGYYTGAKSIKTTLYSVTLEDGTIIKATK